MDIFFYRLWHYSVEIFPALALGFFLSGLIHEFIPSSWVEKNLGKKGLKSIFYATLTGTLLPICCIGSLPVALSFYKKGSRLGPVLAFLVATPATSISALFVTFKLLGLKFAIFIFFAVILMGLLIGIIGNSISFKLDRSIQQICPHCEEKEPDVHRKSFFQHTKSVLKFAFWDMFKEIGPEIIIGLVLAAIIATFAPLGLWIKKNFAGFLGYIFALLFGLIMYICSTATVPLVDAFINQGLNTGAGMVLLIAGPVTSYSTILVLKKEFGKKILLIYLLFISTISLALGYLFSLI